MKLHIALAATALLCSGVPGAAAEWTQQTTPVLAAVYADAGRTLVFSCGANNQFAASLTIPPPALPDTLRGKATLQVVFARDESAAGQVVTHGDVSTVDGKVVVSISEPGDVKAAMDLALGASQHLDVGIAAPGQLNAPVTAAATVSVAGFGAAIVPLVTPCAASAPAAPVGPSSWTTGGSAPLDASSSAASEAAASDDADDMDDTDDMDDPDDLPPDPFQSDVWSEVSGDSAIGGAPTAGITTTDGAILQFECSKGKVYLEYLIPETILNAALAKADQVTIVFQFDPVDGTAPLSWVTATLDHDDLSGVYVGQPAANDWARSIANAQRSVAVGLTLDDPKGNIKEYNAVTFPAKGSAKAIGDLRAGCK